MKEHLKVVACSMLFFSITTYAEERSKFALPLSASLGIGTLESRDMNLKSRTMSAFSFEALPSYRVGKWLLGPHLDYRHQGQLSSLKDAGGNNLKGVGWLVGLGARHEFNDRLFLQGAIDFLGAYDLTRDTSNGEDDNLKSPLGFRIKTGYAFFEKLPNLTFDADFQYLRFNEIHISGAGTSNTFNQLMASVGITYQFGFGKKSSVSETHQAQPALQAEAVLPPTVQEKIAQVEGVEKVGDSLRLSMTGTSFEAGSANLSPAAKEKLTETARLIAQSNMTVRVEGHTDSNGSVARNKVLSKDRAEAVRAFLIEQGVSAEKISAQGFGPSKPIEDNKTKEGRAKNRRVEIYLDEKRE